tara:strand:- start:8528 stop:9994 length:1467 start_codon:yes stop_codon:yes gene_type:complete
LSEVYLEFLDTEIKTLSEALEQFIQSDLNQFKDHGSLPLVVNSVMHSEHDHSQLRDFLEGLKVQGQPVGISIFDINEKILVSTMSDADNFSIDKLAFNNIVDGNLEHRVEFKKIGDDAYTIYSIPIKYNGLPEGVLVGALPSAFDKFFNALERDEDIHTIVGSGQLIVHELGKPAANSFRRKVNLPIVSGFLEVAVSRSKIQLTIVRLVILIFVVMVLLSGVFLIYFRKLGNKLIVEPQKRLENSRKATREANLKLQKANDELLQFSYRTSHDLKAPLTTAKRLSSFAVKDIDAGNLEEAKNNLNKIHNQMIALEILVADILSLARADYDMESVEPVDFSAVLHEVMERLSGLIDESGCKISNEVNLPTPFIGEKARFSQILENLISNSIKYRDAMKDFCSIHVIIRGNSSKLSIVVEDNGVGIPDEYKDEVFKIFKRFHPDMSFGSGLGLSLVHRHVNFMNGEISFESTNEGTKFEISIPNESEREA